jgi:hypothetical protein
MAIERRLAPIQTKLERASEHVRELESEVRNFLEADPYTVGTRRDPESQRLVYYVVSVRDTPVRMSAIAGDILHNLRSALDHLAYQLVLVGGGTPSNQTCFPIYDSVDKYRSNRGQKVAGMRQDAITAIDAIRPYQGGNDALWFLHRLNNIDKHRLLITIGSAYRSMNFGPHIERVLREAWSGVGFLDASKLTIPDLFFHPRDRLFPLRVGDELFRDAPNTEPIENMQFEFEVALGGPQIINGEPLRAALHQVAVAVEKVATELRPILL